MVIKKIETNIRSPGMKRVFAEALSNTIVREEGAFEVPWRVEYDDEHSALRYQNMTPAVLAQTQLYCCDGAQAFATVPASVHAAEIVVVDLREVINDRELGDAPVLYLRWRSSDGRKLVWPIIW